MGYSARILADSLSPDNVRLTTFELTFPRFVLAEFNTHRMLSRNAASSRAIPIKKRIEAVLADPFIPEYWGANQKGMQANETLQSFEQYQCEIVWKRAMRSAVARAKELEDKGLHKQLANRLLEPFSWVTVIASATEWANFFWLRCHKDAQPEFRKIACMARDLYYENEPTPKNWGEWHLPLVFPEDIKEAEFRYIGRCVPGEEFMRPMDEILADICVGRCARVSYLTHDGKRDIQADIDLAWRLRQHGHWSPYEHAAYAQAYDSWSGNFRGWRQYRKTFLATENRCRLAEDPREYEAA